MVGRHTRQRPEIDCRVVGSAGRPGHLADRAFRCSDSDADRAGPANERPIGNHHWQHDTERRSGWHYRLELQPYRLLQGDGQQHGVDRVAFKLQGFQ